MKNFKTLLQCNKYLIIIGFVLIIYILLVTKVIHYETKYKENDTLNGTVISYQFDGDKMMLKVKGKENTIVNYYFKTEKEKDEMFNNIHIGNIVLVQGKIEYPTNNTIPNCFNYKNYLYNKRIYVTWLATKIDIKNGNNPLNKLKDYLVKKAYNMPNKEYYLTFILGDKSLLSSEEYTNYQNNGIAHLLAISGMHISVLLIVLSNLLNRLKRKNIIMCLFLVFFAFLTSFSPSVLRVIVFYILSLINKKCSMNYNSIQLLIITAYILVLINPFIIYDIGFIYSFVVSFGIIYYNEYINGYYFIKLLKMSLVAFLFSLPITASLNYEINIMSIFNNILFVPLISLIVFPLSIISFFLCFLNPLFGYSIYLLNILNNFVSSINIFIIIPKMPILIIVFYYELLLLLKSNKKIIIILLLLILLTKILPFLNNCNTIYYLDVGQGDSILLVNPHNQAILIDTGGKSTYQKQEWQVRSKEYYTSNNSILFFKSIGINKLKYLITTHGDYDHIGEAVNLVNNFKVENVIFNCGSYNDLEKELIKVLDKKKIPYYSCIKELNINKNKLYFLQIKEYNNENDNSNVIYTEINGYKFIFMGDAGIEKEIDILDKYNLSDVDVLKVGHHGSKTSSGERFINEMNPKYSIISVGKNNRYGHPNKEVLENLEDSKIYRTDEDGSVMFKIKNNKLNIETCAP